MARSQPATLESPFTQMFELGLKLLLPEPIDVREIPAPIRHATIFSILEQLQPGEAVRIASDHDPFPLRRQIEIRYAGAFSWSYLLQGPDIWQVEIGRGNDAGSAADCGGTNSEPGSHSCTCGGH